MTGWWRDFGGARFGRPAAPRPLARPALLDRIDRALAATGVVFVVGGAGAGKSLLLAQWAAERAADDVVVVDGGEGWRDLVGVAPLVVSSRTPVDGDAGAVRERDLVFAEDETYQVLAAALTDAAAADGLAPDLHLLTNGWPALVGLAGAWLARLEVAQRRDGVRQLARVEGELYEHLAAAVIGVLRPDEQELLRRLAHLPAVDASVADALDLTEDLAGLPPLVQGVVGRPGFYAVQETLRPIVRARLPLDERARQALLSAYAGM